MWYICTSIYTTKVCVVPELTCAAVYRVIRLTRGTRILSVNSSVCPEAILFSFAAINSDIAPT